jgi:lysyl-tRNA synthetase class 2
MSENSGNEYREQRLANMRELERRGYPPFGGAFERTGRLADIRAGFAEGTIVRAAGRLMTVRSMGKSVFADLRDGSDRFQVYVKRGALPDDAFEAFAFADLGDHVGVTGKLFTTRMGEKTIEVSAWTLLGKALRAPPEKWHGLRDTEQRYRQRYLDLAANPEVRARFDRRIAMVREIRAFLHARGYQEVETPMMQPLAGGAAARPFKTHYQALGIDMYLRIAPELYLKRLLVGGFDRLFEINRNFRNEGIDRTHAPEFTMMELYEAYGDLRTMRALVEGLLSHVAAAVFGGPRVTVGGETIDFTPPFAERAYRDLVRERMGADWFDLAVPAAAGRARDAGLEIDPAWNHLLVTHEVYEKLIEKSLRQPTLVTRLPQELVPLARRCSDDPTVVDVFELVIAGQEVAPAYSEINDPLEQRARFEAQAAGEGGRLDEDFLTALEHGMPPAGGMGLGIDRLAMILSGADALRDVILFPQLRPRAEDPPTA